jgi:hypothetical protein
MSAFDHADAALTAGAPFLALAEPSTDQSGEISNGDYQAKRPWRRRTRIPLCPLSSELDIVRKTLGQHEIATVQTTAIDQTAGIARLGGMDRFGLAGLCRERDDDTPPHGSGADLRSALWITGAQPRSTAGCMARTR